MPRLIPGVHVGVHDAAAVLFDTSFNLHEEPIVDTPAQCARALTDRRVDFIVTTRGLCDDGTA